MSPVRTRSTKRSKSAVPPPPPRPFIHHHLMPPHELLSEGETRKILAELAVPIERLPKIMLLDAGLKTDPKFVAAHEAGEPLVGRLVRVRRPSETAGVAVAYRAIVASPGGD